MFALAIAPISIAAQQGGTTRYVYDDNGRLRAVVSPTGEAAVYEYDAAGNFTAIRRLAANALELLDFLPKQGVPGDTVTFIGVGFGAGVNSVSFNGASANIVSSNATTVVATVPQGATTGLVSITTPGGNVTTAVPFTIRGVRVDPSTARVFPTEMFQFTAVVVAPGGNQGVTWSVNGVDGGNAAVGTITTTGLYTASNQPADAGIVVRATSVSDLSLFGEAVVTVQSFDLVKVAIAALVSIRRGPSLGAESTMPTYGAGVSVRKGSTPSTETTMPAYGAQVSATTGPHISAISPNQIARGSTLTITISGTNLSGATVIGFLDDNGTIDSSITVSDITVNGGGTSLTATVMVGKSTAPGRRVVVISATAGRSQTVDIGTNTIQVIP